VTLASPSTADHNSGRVDRTWIPAAGAAARSHDGSARQIASSPMPIAGPRTSRILRLDARNASSGFRCVTITSSVTLFGSSGVTRGEISRITSPSVSGVNRRSRPATSSRRAFERFERGAAIARSPETRSTRKDRLLLLIGRRLRKNR
jgi:hypothetical protein